MGNSMIGQLASWGGSIALRIPAPFVQELGARAGQSVDLTVEGGALIIKIFPERKKYRLEDLVAGIAEDNKHAEFDFGPDVGKEIINDEPVEDSPGSR